MLPADITRHAHITPPVCGITRWFFCATRPKFCVAWVSGDRRRPQPHSYPRSYMCPIPLFNQESEDCCTTAATVLRFNCGCWESVCTRTLLLAALNFCSLVRFKETLTARWTRLIWKGLIHKYFVLETDNLNILTRIHRSSKRTAQ